MRAEAFLPGAIETATGFQTYRSRFPGPEEAAGPAVLWRRLGTSRGNVLDGVLCPDVVFFHIECRAPEPSAARDIGQLILDRIEQLLTHLVTRYDNQDDSSLQRARTFAHVLVIGLPATVEVATP